MNTDTAERTIAVIAKFREVPEDQITLDTTLEELKMDSLDGLNLIFELEEEFDIMIPDDKALKMKTIGEMVTGIDLIRSGESLDEVTEEDFKSSRTPENPKKRNIRKRRNGRNYRNARILETEKIAAEGN